MAEAARNMWNGMSMCGAGGHSRLVLSKGEGSSTFTRSLCTLGSGFFRVQERILVLLPAFYAGSSHPFHILRDAPIVR